jgi:nitric oxide reductase activation protein
MTNKQPTTALQFHKTAASVRELEVPHHVWTCFGERVKFISFFGDQISLGEDFASLEEVRKALAWYVEQFGGKVKWTNE